jgi:hypothetical protein
LLRALDRLAIGALLFEYGDETRQHALCALSKLFSIRLDPLDRDVWQKIALVEPCGIVQCGAISCEAAIGRVLEGDDIYRHSGVVAPRQRSRADVDERLESRPGIAKMMELAAKIGERLRVARFGPERARNALTWDWRAPRVEDEKGDELLLPCTRSASRKAAVREYAEASEQLEAQTRGGRHSSSLPSVGRNHEGRLRRQDAKSTKTKKFNAGIAEIAEATGRAAFVIAVSLRPHRA